METNDSDGRDRVHERQGPSRRPSEPMSMGRASLIGAFSGLVAVALVVAGIRASYRPASPSDAVTNAQATQASPAGVVAPRALDTRRSSRGAARRPPRRYRAPADGPMAGRLSIAVQWSTCRGGDGERSGVQARFPFGRARGGPRSASLVESRVAAGPSGPCAGWAQGRPATGPPRGRRRKAAVDLGEHQRRRHVADVLGPRHPRFTPSGGRPAGQSRAGPGAERTSPITLRACGRNRVWSPRNLPAS